MSKITSKDNRKVDPDNLEAETGKKVIVVRSKDGESEDDAFERVMSEHENEDVHFVWHELIIEVPVGEPGVQEENNDSSESDKKNESSGKPKSGEKELDIAKIREESDDEVPLNKEDLEIPNQSNFPSQQSEVNARPNNSRLGEGQELKLSKWVETINIVKNYETSIKVHKVSENEDLYYFSFDSGFKMEMAVNEDEFNINLTRLALSMIPRFDKIVMDPEKQIEQISQEGKILTPSAMGFDLMGVRDLLFRHEDVKAANAILVSMLINPGDKQGAEENKVLNPKKIKNVAFIQTDWENELRTYFKAWNLSRLEDIDSKIKYYEHVNTLDFSLASFPVEEWSREKYKVFSPPNSKMFFQYLENNLVVRSYIKDVWLGVINSKVKRAIEPDPNLASRMQKLVAARNGESTFDTDIINMISSTGANNYIKMILMSCLFGRYVSLRIKTVFVERTLDLAVNTLVYRLMYPSWAFSERDIIRLNNMVAFHILPILPGFDASAWIWDDNDAANDKEDFLMLNYVSRKALFKKYDHSLIWDFFLPVGNGFGFMDRKESGLGYQELDEHLSRWTSDHRDMWFPYLLGTRHYNQQNFSSPQWVLFSRIVRQYANNQNGGFKFSGQPNRSNKFGNILTALAGNSIEYYELMYQLYQVIKILSVSSLAFPITSDFLDTLSTPIISGEKRIELDIDDDGALSAIFLAGKISVSPEDMLTGLLEEHLSLKYYFNWFSDLMFLFKSVYPEEIYSTRDIVKLVLELPHQDPGIERFFLESINRVNDYDNMSFFPMRSDITDHVEKIVNVIHKHPVYFGFLSHFYYAPDNHSPIDDNIFSQSYIFNPNSHVDREIDLEELKDLTLDWKINEIFESARYNKKVIKINAPLNYSGLMSFNSPITVSKPFTIDLKNQVIQTGSLGTLANFKNIKFEDEIKMDDPKWFEWRAPDWLVDESEILIGHPNDISSYIKRDNVVDEQFEIFDSFSMIPRQIIASKVSMLV